MASASTLAKKKYNQAHYARFTLECETELLTELKAKCIKEGISVSSVLIAAAREYLKKPAPTPKPEKKAKPKPSLGARRKAVKAIIAWLENILYEEQDYQDAMPENFRSGSRFSDSEDAVQHLQASIDELGEAYTFE